jgi:hypothetical protein
LVFLAAFIGLYFVIEIQAKSKIAEGRFYGFNLNSSFLQRLIRVLKVHKMPPTSREWLNCCEMSATRLTCGYLPRSNGKISRDWILGGKFGQQKMVSNKLGLDFLLAADARRQNRDDQVPR